MSLSFGQAPVAGALGRVPTEADDMPLTQPQRPALLGRERLRTRHLRHHAGIVAVDDDGRPAAEHTGLGLDVGRDRAVPVEVVFAHVEQRRRIGFERRAVGELEARQLEHPDLGQTLAKRLERAGLERVGQRLQHRRADVAGRRHALAAALDEQRRHRRGGRLAVAAGDGDQLRARSRSSAPQVLQRRAEQVELTEHADAGHAAPRSAEQRCRRRAARGPGSSAPGRRRRGRQTSALVDGSRDAAGARSANSAERGASARESQTRTVAPCRALHSAIARPDSPKPRTSTVLSCSSRQALISALPDAEDQGGGALCGAK